MSNSISGSVVDATGAALANAKVWLTPVVSSIGPRQFTVTDSLGNFTFSNLGQAQYQIIVTSSGVLFSHPKIVTIVSSNVSGLFFAAVALNAPNQ
jgi:hypothetical protein